MLKQATKLHVALRRFVEFEAAGAPWRCRLGQPKTSQIHTSKEIFGRIRECKVTFVL